MEIVTRSASRNVHSKTHTLNINLSKLISNLLSLNCALTPDGFADARIVSIGIPFQMVFVFFLFACCLFRSHKNRGCNGESGTAKALSQSTSKSSSYGKKKSREQTQFSALVDKFALCDFAFNFFAAAVCWLWTVISDMLSACGGGRVFKLNPNSRKIIIADVWK